jgi:cell wall-associated NlpC family hydrolase
MSRVDSRIAKQVLYQGKGMDFPLGCAQFVSYVMGKKHKSTSEWTRGEAVKIGDLSDGDVVGWGGNGSPGHVTIYVSGEDYKFIDVNGSGAPREMNSYGGKQLYRMRY